MHDLLNFDFLKFTGKAAHSTEVNSISFKSVDTATYYDDMDSLNYPIFEPYLESVSYSYENWNKFKFTINDEYLDKINSRGLTIQKTNKDYCYNVTYTKIKNLSFWFNTKPSAYVKINVGTTGTYIRPNNSESLIAVEDINTYYNVDGSFTNNIKFPIFFNGKNEIDITQLDGAVSDDFFVWQLQILKGLKYQVDPRLVGLKLHYELF